MITVTDIYVLKCLSCLDALSLSNAYKVPGHTWPWCLCLGNINNKSQAKNPPEIRIGKHQSQSEADVWIGVYAIDYITRLGKYLMEARLSLKC